MRDWSKLRAPDRGDVDRKDYERSKVYKARQERAKRGAATYRQRQEEWARQKGIELQKTWEELIRIRGKEAQEMYREVFRKQKGGIRKDVTKKIFEETMKRIGKRMNLPRGLWRKY